MADFSQQIGSLIHNSPARQANNILLAGFPDKKSEPVSRKCLVTEPLGRGGIKTQLQNFNSHH